MTIKSKEIRDECDQNVRRNHYNRRRFLGIAAMSIAAAEFVRIGSAEVITVPTITLEGDANGAPHPDASSYAKKFSGKYVHRVIDGGVGHNLPQEAPQDFAKAVLDVDRS
jgi:pimeloyl-ACP methyl ester carboxylesterase